MCEFGALCVQPTNLTFLDIYAITLLGKPVGVVEVKKPQQGVLDHPNVLGQLLDYLLQLRYFHGLLWSFGILTTYEEWRICWLPNQQSDEATQQTIIEAPRVKTIAVELPRLPCDVDVDEEESPNLLRQSPYTRNRQIRASPIIKCEEKKLLPILASVF